jgi:hypothetical protein
LPQYTSLKLFKRNQVEEAVVQTLGARDKRRIAELKLRLKRLLVTDRRSGRRRRSGDKGRRHYAFYSQEPPGSGVEVMFSAYEAFALLVALRVLEYGVPQAKVVGILREVRSDLETAYREILQKDPKKLFDRQKVPATAKPGMLATDNTDPVFLAFVKLGISKGRVRATVSICRGLHQLWQFINQHTVPGAGATFFEFTRLMHALAANLSQTRPIKRGRYTV